MHGYAGAKETCVQRNKRVQREGPLPKPALGRYLAWIGVAVAEAIYVLAFGQFARCHSVVVVTGNRHAAARVRRFLAVLRKQIQHTTRGDGRERGRARL